MAGLASYPSVRWSRWPAPPGSISAEHLGCPESSHPHDWVISQIPPKPKKKNNNKKNPTKKTQKTFHSSVSVKQRSYSVLSSPLVPQHPTLGFWAGWHLTPTGGLWTTSLLSHIIQCLNHLAIGDWSKWKGKVRWNWANKMELICMMVKLSMIG